MGLSGMGNGDHRYISEGSLEEVVRRQRAQGKTESGVSQGCGKKVEIRGVGR